VRRFQTKRITDPVHGSIGISDLEAKVIGSKSFQRLRHVKQLGLAHYVFPGADHSRFAHSLGACHVTLRLLEAIRNSDCGVPIDDDEIQLYRLAALLHDVGHYPFSHAMEEAVASHYSAGVFHQKTRNPKRSKKSDQEDGQVEFYNHERLGKQILLNDPEIADVLIKAKIEPKTLSSVIRRERPPKFANLISSDLDADRIDYLLRDAHQSGLPYGDVDLDYLLSQARLDKDSRICFTRKASRTIDHFLLSRYFSYQQISYHKTVAAFEMVLKKVIATLLRHEILDCSDRSIDKAVGEGSWCQFDDQNVFQKIRELEKFGRKISPEETIEASCIIARAAPKLLGEIEFLDKRQSAVKKDFYHMKQSIVEKLPMWSKDFKINSNLWYVWGPSVITLTKIGSHVPVSFVQTEDDIDKAEQSVRILNPHNNTSETISSLGHSLMHILSDYALYSLRVYALLSESQIKHRHKIAARIQSDLPHLRWTNQQPNRKV